MRKKIHKILILFSILPFSASSFLPPNSLFGKVVNKINTDKKIVALTFDDGPNNVYTHKVLEILREKGVKATFFLTGANIPGNELLIRTMQVEGHAIGNHSFNHPNMTFAFPSKIKEEVESAQKAIEEISGQKNHLFRAPYGNYNNPFLMKYLKDNNYSIIGWSVDPTDWQNKTPDKILDNVLNNVVSGSIILLHDGPENKGGVKTVDRLATIEALTEIIDGLKKQGYQFLTIPEMIENENILGAKSERRWSIWNFLTWPIKGSL